MNAEEAVVYNALAGEASVTSLLATYMGGPAIFRGEAEQDAVAPLVVFSTVSVNPWDGYTYIGFESMVDVRCYVNRTWRDQPLLHNLGEACWAALHRKRPEPTGNKEFLSTMVIGGPSELPIEEHRLGQFMTIKIVSYLPE